jgi:hypothetical protein
LRQEGILSTNKPKSQLAPAGRRPGVYTNVDPQVKEAFEREADKRNRSIGSLVFNILYIATDGFTDWSIADRPLVRQEEVTT